MAAYIAKNKEINLLFAESEKMYRKLIESIKIGIYMADSNDVLFFVNKAFVDILGFNSKNDLLGLNLSSLYVDPKEAEDLKARLQTKNFVHEYEIKTKRKDGEVIILSVTSNSIRNDRGEVIGIEGTVHDITEKKNLEEKLQSEKVKLEEIINFDERLSTMKNLNEMVDFVVDKTTKILDADKCSLMLIDKDSGDLSIQGAKGLSDDVVANAKIKLGEPVAGEVAKSGRALLVENIEYDKRFQRKNSPRYKTESFLSVPLKIDDTVKGVINVTDKRHNGHATNGNGHFTNVDLKVLLAIVREVASAIENVELYNELKVLTVIDPLTNIYNFRQLTKSLDYEIQQLKRFKGKLCFMMIDVDDFKIYNDDFGHVEGDTLLKAVSKILKDNLREVDIVCRYAGDEFAVILPETDTKGAQIAAKKIFRAVERLNLKRPVTVSIGIAPFRTGMTRYDLIREADKALYEAKNQGKNTVCAFK